MSNAKEVMSVRPVSLLPGAEASASAGSEGAFLSAADTATSSSVRPASGTVAGSALGQYRRVAGLVAVTDAAAIAGATLVVRAFGYRADGLLRDLPIALAFLAVQLVLFVGFRLYDLRRLPAADEVRRIVAALTVGTTVLVTASFWSMTDLSRAWIGSTLGSALVLVTGSRWMWRLWMRRARAHGMLTFRTLIVGTNDEASRLARQMSSKARSGFDPVGFVVTEQGSPEVDGFPVVGGLAGIREAVAATGADCVFVASSAVRPEEFSRLARRLHPEAIEVRVSTNLPEVLMSRLSIQPVGGIPSLSVRPARLTGLQAVLKRSLDLVLATIGLLFGIPLWIAIAIAIKATSPGPVLFRQERVGMRGRRFTILKFRTMVRGAETMIPGIRHLNEADGPLFKIRRDPRITRTGRFLRRWSLDELPQLVNVLRGDMSLVGPRPPLPQELTDYEEWHFDRLEVRPGMTGLGQVAGRSNLSFEQTVRLDLFYIENWSLAYDLYLLLKTAPALMSRVGAY
jgi:exopolysaccharide biosynthesis polyprenyl glycosylphosphotransferase